MSGIWTYFTGGRPRFRVKDDHGKEGTNRRSATGMIHAARLNPLQPRDIGSRQAGRQAIQRGGDHVLEEGEISHSGWPVVSAAAATEEAYGQVSNCREGGAVSKSTAGCRGRVSGPVARKER